MSILKEYFSIERYISVDTKRFFTGCRFEYWLYKGMRKGNIGYRNETDRCVNCFYRNGGLQCDSLMRGLE